MLYLVDKLELKARVVYHDTTRTRMLYMACETLQFDRSISIGEVILKKTSYVRGENQICSL